MILFAVDAPLPVRLELSCGQVIRDGRFTVDRRGRTVVLFAPHDTLPFNRAREAGKGEQDAEKYYNFTRRGPLRVVRRGSFFYR